MKGYEAGFTIVELVMFLAISGMLLLMVLFGTGSLAARQRFSDSTDGLLAYIQSQYDEVVSGVNIRSANAECTSETATDAGMSNRCLLIGKLLTLNGKTITSQYVLSTAALLGTESTDKQRLQKATVKVSDVDSSMYEMKWLATTFNATRSTQLPSGGPSRGVINSIAFLKLPDSGRIVQLYYASTTGYTATNSLREAITNDYPGAYNPDGLLPANPSLAICVKNDDDLPVAKPRSAIIFSQGQGAGAITTNYNPGGVLCP